MAQALHAVIIEDGKRIVASACVQPFRSSVKQKVPSFMNVLHISWRSRVRTQSEDTDEQAEMVQIELLRQSTVSRRLSMVFSLSETAIGLARRAIRLQNLNLADRDLLLRFAAIRYGPELAEKVGVHLKERSG